MSQPVPLGKGEQATKKIGVPGGKHTKSIFSALVRTSTTDI